MTTRVVILGSGSSMGVPRLGGPDGRGDWGRCDPTEPKNRRTRCSILVQRASHPGDWYKDVTNVLVDTSPDFRAQALAAGIGHLDAALITHDHADQTHGIDDLRILAYRNKSRIPVYIDRETAPALVDRFGYCFRSSEETGYPAILDEVAMPSVGTKFHIDGPGGPIAVTSFLQTHGAVMSLGFVFGEGINRVAYSSDLNALDDRGFQLVNGCDAWIVDALRYDVHASHSHLAQTLDWIERAKVGRGILTNLHIDMDYETVLAETPAHVEPAYDGMILNVGEH